MANVKRSQAAQVRTNLVMVGGPGVLTPERPREYASRIAGQGVALLAHAFNACDNPELPYRYSESVRQKFFNTIRQLAELYEYGEIIEDAEARAEAARTDAGFQRFMATAVDTGFRTLLSQANLPARPGT